MRLIALLFSCAVPATAQEFALSMPIDCILDDTCYIQNYVDVDPSGDATNFLCSPLTYDGHKGTDFGLNSLSDMQTGVAVLAAADGLVKGVRNDMRDVLYTSDLEGEINGRDCGNGVVIYHGDGWETQYCHMREGSIDVQTGDRVEAGDILGLVGLSGRTQFPHVHISVRRDGAVVDPFTPDGPVACDVAAGDTLWDDPIETPQGGLLNAGFADNVPAYDAVKAGTANVTELSANSPIVLWGFLFGARPGDVVSLSFDGPDGALFETDDVLDRTQALAFRAGGLNAPDGGWAAGEYSGVVTHTRDGVILDRLISTIALR